MPDSQDLGKNILYSISGTKLTLVIDLAQDFGPSKSGKSVIIATTSGNKTMKYGDKEIKVGINIYRQSSGSVASKDEAE